MNVRSYFYFIPLYALITGFLYVWGYWGPFRINPFVYMGIEDVIKTAIIPITTSAVALFVGAIIGEVLSPDLPSGGGADTPFGRVLRRHERLIGVFYLIGVCLVILFVDSDQKWFVLPALVVPPLGVIANRIGIFRELITNYRVRTFVIYVIASLPILAFSTGRIDANHILNADAFDYIVDSNIPSLNSQIDKNALCKFRYIGRIGQTVFAMSFPNKRLTVVEIGPDSSVSTMSGKECK